MSNREDATSVAEAILQHTSCLIATHINPEGDAIGSMLALALALEQRGMTVCCYDRDGVPENNRFLPTWERVSRELPAIIPPLVIYVDADRLERCGLSLETLPGAIAFARIDHHHSEAVNPGLAIVDPLAAATGELVFDLLPLLGATLTPEIATCLHTALVVDTGRFSYTNTTPNTLRVAANLIEGGADFPTIIDWIWGRTKFAAAKLTGIALAGLQLSADGRIAWAQLREEDFRAAGAQADDTEEIIDSIRGIRGAGVAILFSEKQGDVRLSMRSNGEVDVAKIARSFGGGGHVKAAGFTYNGPIEYAVCDVLRAIEQSLTV